MDAGTDLVPAEEEDGQKARFQKKAKIPSAARALPNTSPTKREYAAQFVPNWNSITTPLATPRAKVRPKIRTQNRVICWNSGFRVLRYSASMRTRMTPRPMLSGGKI